MTSVVAGTHAIIWYLLEDPRLSKAAGYAFDAATSAGQMIYIPTMCIVGMTYLTEKGRIPEHALPLLERVLASPDSPFHPIELSLDIANAIKRISRDTVPDMPDRVIAATALASGLPLVTRDGNIRASGIETIW